MIVIKVVLGQTEELRQRRSKSDCVQLDEGEREEEASGGI